MRCPKCSAENAPHLSRCSACGDSLAVALLEVVRGQLSDKIRFLRPRPYSLGRARHNDLVFNERSISKLHARIDYLEGRFSIEDAGSLHGVYVNAAKVKRAELVSGTQIQLGNVTLKFSLLGLEPTTGAMAKLPWVEQQQLLLSLVQTLNATLVLSQVLEQVLDAVMRITGAGRGFLLLADGSPEDEARFPAVAGLRLRVARGSGLGSPADGYGISATVVAQALASGKLVTSPGMRSEPEAADPQVVETRPVQSVLCLPLCSPRALQAQGSSGRPLGVLYVDNAGSAEPFSSDALRAAEALARHAALAIENAQLFEREQHTIEELQKTQRQLLQSEKLATIGQMAAGIAHELNTPLTYILGNLELLEAQSLAEPQRQMLAAVARGADRIGALSRRLLTFIRPEREELQPLDVNEVLGRSLELCRYQVAGAGLRLVEKLAPSLPPVRGAANLLEMAFINLLVNAVHAMTAGGGTLTVSTTLVDGEPQIVFADEGPGIAPEVRGSLFDPFVTTKPAGEGTGLGLSTVLMVVERHGGRVDFQTAEGRGTTFRITLPPAPAPA